MDTVLRIHVDALDEEFIQSLKKQFGPAEIQIHIAQTPRDWLTEECFWALIDKLDWSKEGEDYAVVEPVVQALSEMPIANIHQFEDLLAEKLWRIDTRQHAENYTLEAPDRFFSADSFLYGRCCVVANGRSFYDKVYEDPSQMPKGLSFERLLSIATMAYERKTGKTFVHIPVVSYETYSNEAGWQ